MNYPTWIHPADVLHCQAPGCSHIPTKTKTALAVADEPTPRFAVRGTNLCNWHHAQLPRVLGDLAGLVHTLEQAAYARTKTRDQYARTADTGGVHGSGPVQDVGASWNPHAAAVLAEVTDWTGYLTRIINREHPTDWLNEHRPPADRLAIIARFLAAWWSHYPDVGNYILADALQHRRYAIAAQDAPLVRRLTLSGSSCAHLVEIDPVHGPLLCGAALYGIIRADDTRPSQILCSTNPNHPQLDRADWLDALPR